MLRTGCKNLTYTQRLILEQLLLSGLHKTAIARSLGICVSTVYNEIKRGTYFHKQRSGHNQFGESYYRYIRRYSPEIAEQKYRYNMTAKGRPLKIGNDYAFIQHVEKRVLKDKLSPCAVLGEIKRDKMFRTDISKTTLYRYISDGIFLNLTMRDLPMARRKRHYRKAVPKRPPKGTSIEKRPAAIAERDEFGHWEMDCVIGKQYTHNVLLTLTERVTRREIIRLMPDKKAASVVRCIDELERTYGTRFGRIFKSITVDNGPEFSDLAGLETSPLGHKRTNIYYCHPYTSCERGTNERLNRDIRRRLPKGTDFSKLTPEEIQAVEDWINAYPRKMFGFASAADMFRDALAAL